jgi:23S rRNA (cytosine1962-C5)-methyltransferase
VQADRIDAVVVGHQDPHAPIFADRTRRRGNGPDAGSQIGCRSAAERPSWAPIGQDVGVPLPPDLPRPAATRLAVRVTADAVRRLRGGHPWLFEGSIRSVNREGAPGDLAVVFDDDRQFVAVGLWDPASPIRVKVLHQGHPATIDDAWFHAAIAASVERRAHLVATNGTATDGYRFVNGENDGLPGLVVDRYADVAVIKVYGATWFAHLATVVPIVAELLAVRSVVLRLSRSAKAVAPPGLADGTTVHGPEVTEPVTFHEHGLVFEADVVHGQKTGHFLDQRDNRAAVRELTHAARVLDVFSHTGGFTVHAAAGGANAVHAIDSSPYAVRAVERHVALNVSDRMVRAAHLETTCADAFGALEQLAGTRRRYDLVIVDPPSFAQSSATTARALTSYARLTTLALGLLETGGTLVQSSCSSRVSAADFFRAVHVAATRCGVELEELSRTGHAADHPVTFPEGAYLKAIFARVERPPALRARA